MTSTRRWPLNYLSFVGVEGYILVNPVDGSGVYRIGSLLNGGESGGDPSAAPGNSCPACSGPNQPVNSMVDMTSGAWRESATDLSLPAVGLPMVLSRTYSSRAQGASAFGYGWMHPYGVFLRAEPDGGFSPAFT